MVQIKCTLLQLNSLLRISNRTMAKPKSCSSHSLIGMSQIQQIRRLRRQRRRRRKSQRISQRMTRKRRLKKPISSMMKTWPSRVPGTVFTTPTIELRRNSSLKTTVKRFIGEALLNWRSLRRATCITMIPFSSFMITEPNWNLQTTCSTNAPEKNEYMVSVWWITCSSGRAEWNGNHFLSSQLP